jgi:CheY-like chemotaxis protein/CRP-like cAMP-binding protein
MKKILIIEDNLEVRENIAEILELCGYSVTTAENGKIGVQHALENTPDLILCDVMMPELDGFGVLNILSKKPITCDIPFIYLTAKSEKEDLRRGMNLGADDYLTKPFYKDELLAAIEMRLSKVAKMKHRFEPTEQGLLTFINEAKGYEDLQQLSTDCEVRQYAKRTLIYEENKTPRHLFLINSGKVKIVKSNQDGREFILEILSQGSFLGFLDIIGGNAYSESAFTLEDTQLSLIPKEAFLRLLYSNKDVSARFIKLLANHAAEKEEQILALAYHNVRKRIAGALLKLYEPNPTAGISMYREDLAALVGTAKETLIRMLSEFKEDGYLDIRNGVIYILKADKLANVPG